MAADLGGFHPPRPVDNTLLDLQNSSYPTQPHSIIAKYILLFFRSVLKKLVIYLSSGKTMHGPFRQDKTSGRDDRKVGFHCNFYTNHLHVTTGLFTKQRFINLFHNAR